MAGGKEMKIAIKIAGQVESSFKNALGQATKGLGSLTKKVGAATLAAAAAVGAMGVAAVNVGKEFETAMSQVAATMLIDKNTEAGRKSFETLENAARECGATTAFSATEAAEALNYLALAGYDADKAATALPTVLKLAGASAMDLATASDMVTDSMSALGIEATEQNLTQFSDQLAKTASRANTSVSQLGEAILTVGGTAQGLAGGTAELNTALGILADSGMKGAEGGTHLRNMILSLQNPRNADAAKLFEQMGLSAYDAEGNMRSLGDTFGDLNASLAGASAADVNSTLATIFKQTDLAAARAMLAATSDSVESLGTVMDAALADSGKSMASLGINLKEMAAGFDKATTQEAFAAQMMDQFGMTGEQAQTLFNGLQAVVSGTGNRFEELSAAVEDSAGACEDMYSIQLDNLDGDIAILKSSLEDLGISVYKDLNGPLREMTQLGTSMVGELSKAYQEGGMEGMVGAVGGCISEIANVIAEYAPKIVSMGVSLIQSFVGGIVQNSGTIADGAGDALSAFINGLFTLVPQVILAGIDIVTQLAHGVTEQLPQLANNGTQAVSNFVAGITQRLPNVITTALTLVQALISSIGANAPQLIASAVQLIGSLIQGLISMLPQIAQMGIQLIQGLAQGIVANLPLMLNMAVQIIVSLVNGLVTMLPSIIQGGIQIVISLLQGIIGNLGNIVQAAAQIVMAIITGLLTAIPQLIAAIPQLICAIIETLLTTNWAQVGMDILKGIASGIMSMAKSFGSSVKNAVLDLFGLGGKSGSDNTTAAAQSGQAVALDYANGITGGIGAASAAAGALPEAAFSSIDFTAASSAGTNAGTAFGSSLSAGLSNFTIDTSAMGLDTTSLTETLGTAGTEGMAALGTGITDGAADAATAVDGLGADITASFDSTWNKTQSSAQTAMNTLVSTVTNAAQSAATAIKAAFANMVITIPKPKLPEINVSYDKKDDGNGGSVKVPKFNVSWNALGGIFTKPTILGSSAGMQGVGEAGSEAILPLDTLWAQMRKIVGDIVKQNSGISIIDTLIEKLKGINGGGAGQGEPQLAGAGGSMITYSPTYNLYGSATKEDAVEAERMSQAEFNRMMKQWQKEYDRKKF